MVAGEAVVVDEAEGAVELGAREEGAAEVGLELTSAAQLEGFARDWGIGWGVGVGAEVEVWADVAGSVEAEGSVMVAGALGRGCCSILSASPVEISPKPNIRPLLFFSSLPRPHTALPFLGPLTFSPFTPLFSLSALIDSLTSTLVPLGTPLLNFLE